MSTVVEQLVKVEKYSVLALSKALEITGRVQESSGVCLVIAEKIERALST
jgi:hypothetical protein